MPRVYNDSPDVMLLAEVLRRLVAQHGSVRRLCQAMNRHTEPGDRLHANQLHRMLSDRPHAAVNQGTVDLVERALTKMLEGETCQG